MSNLLLTVHVRLLFWQTFRLHSTGQNWSSQRIRKTFLDFFTGKHRHVVVPSSSVVPRNDNSLLFTNAGMNQFKPIFLGEQVTDNRTNFYQRVCNSQKCIRVGGKHNDLDDVGRDLYHHTFFEMLGNWSFGDYYKQEACEMAWNLLTEIYGLLPERLYVTYFAGNDELGLAPDDDCKEIWLKLGVSPERILPFGIKDNFWEMGHVGPCGSCTEIHYDHTDSAEARYLVNTGSANVIEVWNLVFIEFERKSDGSLKPLLRKHVDTGMGLERLAAILNGSVSNYNTDLFVPLISAIEKGSDICLYGGSLESSVDVAYRVVADHIRMITVAISDGVRPGPQAAGHRLRRVVQRAVRTAHDVLKLPQGFLRSLVPLVVSSLGDAYPELKKDPETVCSIIDDEEQKFLRQCERGRRRLHDIIAQLETDGATCLSGKHAWEVHSQMGLPEDLICTVSHSCGMTIDMEEFRQLLAVEQEKSALDVARQQEEDVSSRREGVVSRLSAHGVKATEDASKYEYMRGEHGYSFSPVTATIQAICLNGDIADSVCSEAGECSLVVDTTCMYSTAGGQVSDEGIINTGQAKFLVGSVQNRGGYVFHNGRVVSGTVRSGSECTVSVDGERRQACMRSHTATHLLNAALRQLFGDACSQQGSLVQPDKLRLDFSCQETLTLKQLEEVERIVSDIIDGDTGVFRQELPIDQALEVPRIVTLPDELYPDTVFVVSVGNDAASLSVPSLETLHAQYSVELCGGTHVLRTSDIGPFVITKQSTPSNGIHRLTAVTANEAILAEENASALQAEVSSLSAVALKDSEHFRVKLRRLSTIQRRLSEAVLPARALYDLTRQITVIKTSISRAEKAYWKRAVKAAVGEVTEVLRQSNDSVVVHRLRGDTNEKVLIVGTDVCRDRPLMLFGVNDGTGAVVGRCFVPEDFASNFGVTAIAWANHVALSVGGKTNAAGKLAAERYYTFTVDAKCVNCVETFSRDVEQCSEEFYNKIS